MACKHIVTAAVPGEVKQRLQRAADADGRTLSWVICRVLNSWADAQALREDVQQSQAQ
jgi:hypothetical protein